ncbi:TonB-dependent receptor [Polymorphobacter fuscus]|uniref:TonB-dependent receptor n=2 Tax=Sandarakinorhabdus fusca TaxID=1439888 RepID=A0A7C9KX67_9SPHN|nr:TonB-dependent receptor [Polymorphobacter fuscus]KAB7647452.1 TonB-dependent receptor [Polymorphobacter fuscus]MQT16706.1 TonB-dependent receptor [Polymorphobacter fuscus]
MSVGRWLAGAALVVWSGPGWAQAALATAAVNAPVVDEEEIVVRAPIAEAQALAIQEQRRADNLVSVLAADSIGRFPDQNSAAALSRLPAVAVQRDQGQERYIQVRGAPNRWTSVLVDGVPIVGVDEGGGSRAFRFDAIPSVILSSVTVNKSLTADLPAEAVVALIDMKTFSPMDRKGFDVAGDVGYGWMELGGGQQRQASLRASWSNDKVGVLLAGSHYWRDQVTDNREFAYGADNLPTTFDFRNYRLTRENNGLSAGLEFQPSEGQRIFIKGIFTEFNDDEERNQYAFQNSTAFSGTRGAVSGDLVGVSVRGTMSDSDYRNRNYLVTLGGDHELTDDWSATWRGNYTKVVNTSYIPLLLQNQAINPFLRPSLTYDRSNPDLPILSLFTTVPGPGTPPNPARVRGVPVSAFNQAAFDFNVALPLYSSIRSESYTAKADVLGAIGDVEVRFGAQYDDRDIDGNVFSQITRNITGLPAGDYVTDRPWVTGFPSGTSFNYVDNKRLRVDLERALDAQTPGGFDVENFISPTDRYEIGEKLFAAYASGAVEFGTARVVFGGRLENFVQESSGFVRVGTTVTPLTVRNSYWDFFPSVNAKIDLTDDIVFRLAGQRSVSRPGFGQVRTGAAISDTSTPGTVSGGNPNLRPEYTWGVDTALEYYIPGNGLLSASIYYRWVSNVLFDSRTRVNSDIYNSGGIDRSNYDLISTLNGDNGKLYGLELSYLQQFKFLPGALSGFGFQGNISFIGGSFDTFDRTGAGFPGTSDRIVNASLFYEKYGFSGRVSYQWRSDWVDTLGGFGVGVNGDERRAGYANLDVALRYAVTPNITVFVDATNLTNETYVAYQGARDRPTEVEQIGRRYLGGVRFNF